MAELTPIWNLAHATARWLALVAVCTTAVSSLAQGPSYTTYVLLSKSQLTDDCPICDRIPIVVPLAGTFQLAVSDSNPLYTTYELRGISFHGGAETGPQYEVQGSGVYRVGGEVALSQEMSLDTRIKNFFTNVVAYLVNSTNRVDQPWPGIHIDVDQTNGTPAQVYRLSFFAVPVPVIRSATVDDLTGDVRLEWNNNGAQVQVERASMIAGPYSPISPVSGDSSFTDPGVSRVYPQLYYRLRLLN